MRKKVIMIICCAAIVFSSTACSQKPSADESSNTYENQPDSGSVSTNQLNGEQVITSTVLQDMDTYITFGHIGLGIQTQIPDLEMTSWYRYDSMRVYLHGFTMNIVEGDAPSTVVAYDFSIESPFSDESNLAQLPIVIAEEKVPLQWEENEDIKLQTDDAYQGLFGVTEFSRTEEIQIGDYQTVYFEVDTSSLEDDTIIGYSLLFEGKPICVSVRYWADNPDEFKTEHFRSKEYLQNCLQYMILTLSSYQGEAFYELQPDNNINRFYTKSIGSSSSYQSSDLPGEVNGIRLYGHESGSMSRSKQLDRGMMYEDLIYPHYSSGANIGGEKTELLHEQLLGLSYDNLLPAVIEMEDWPAHRSWFSRLVPSIVQESDVVVHGIEMKRYELMIYRDDELHDFWIVYTFVYEDVPYLWKLDSRRGYIYEYTEEELTYEMDLMRLQADTIIRTIKLDFTDK